jgi:hypothetical protein
MTIDPEPRTVIVQLIAIGDYGIDAVPASLAADCDDTAWHLISKYCEHFLRAADALSQRDLENLIRGLVHYSRVCGTFSTGGSVSPVIPLYRCLAKRVGNLGPGLFDGDQSATENQQFDRLTLWILDHRVNPYEPFGEDDRALDAEISAFLRKRLGGVDNRPTRT